jgi:hypothetical protein
MGNIELNVVTRGAVSGGVKSEIVNTLKDCYKQFGTRLPYRIDILITDTEAVLRDYLRQEKFNLGVTDESDNDDVCLYDIVQGFPRVTLSAEKLSQFSKQARQGVIRHQAAHSALHGSLEYRIFRIPDDCRQTATIKSIDSNTLEHAMHKLSLAVKDYESSKLLVEHNFVNCQLAFALEWIKAPPTGRQPHKEVRMERGPRFINQMVLLKPILFCHPLISLPKSKKIALEMQVMLGRRIEEIIQDLPENEQLKLIQVAGQIADNLNSDTHQNVDSALHFAMSLA